MTTEIQSNMKTLLMIVVVAALAVAITLAIVPKHAPYGSFAGQRSYSKPSYSSSSYQPSSSSSSSKSYPGCSFDGDYTNDKPGACP